MLGNKARTGMLVVPHFARLKWLSTSGRYLHRDFESLCCSDSHPRVSSGKEVMVIVGAKKLSLSSTGSFAIYAVLVFNSRHGLGWVDEREIEQVEAESP